MGALVTVFDVSLARLKELDNLYGPRLMTCYSSRATIEQALVDADLVIGGVLVPGAAAPKLITRDMLKVMQQGSVIVDVAIDQGGCVETSRPTTHQDPTFVVDGVVHYCVANMPGGVARTSTLALTNATLPFVIELANKGYWRAVEENRHLRNGLNIHRGAVTYEAVARALGYAYTAVI